MLATLLIVSGCERESDRLARDGETDGGAVQPTSGGQNKLVSFDLRSGIETVHDDLNFVAATATAPQVLSGGEWEEAPGDPMPFNFTNLAPVATPTSPYFSMVTRVAAFWDSPQGLRGEGDCSGTLIGPRYLLTAAHCVYSTELGWPGAVAVAPGAHIATAPFGTAKGEEIFTFTRYVETKGENWDIAVVSLDRPVGYLAGWRGFGSHPDCDYWEEPGWSITGYPAWPDPVTTISYDGTMMASRSGSFEECSSLPGTATFESYAINGMSGSGVVKRYNDGEGQYDIVWGVHTFKVANDLAGVTRFDEFMFRSADFAIESTTPEAADLVVLDTRSPKVNVHPGEAVEGISVLLANIGKADFSGEVRAALRISEDDEVDADDQIVQTIVEQVQLGRNATMRLNWPPVHAAPNGTAPGHYFLGVDLLVADANDSNDRTTGQDMEPIRVLNRFEFPIDDVLQIRPF